MLGVYGLSVLGSFMPLHIYSSETMIWKEKERSRIRAVQMDNLRGLMGNKRMDKLPNTRIRELCGVIKGLMVFSDSSAMWR